MSNTWDLGMLGTKGTGCEASKENSCKEEDIEGLTFSALWSWLPLSLSGLIRTGQIYLLQLKYSLLVLPAVMNAMKTLKLLCILEKTKTKPKQQQNSLVLMGNNFADGWVSLAIRFIVLGVLYYLYFHSL